jgi:hypothetical protein
MRRSEVQDDTVAERRSDAEASARRNGPPTDENAGHNVGSKRRPSGLSATSTWPAAQQDVARRCERVVVDQRVIARAEAWRQHAATARDVRAAGERMMSAGDRTADRSRGRDVGGLAL